MRYSHSLLLIGLTFFSLTACQALRRPQPTPEQVVYRFDDHRYLTLKGYLCEGALWYHDTKLGINSEVQSQFYRIFTGKYIHPSQQYIAISGYGGGFIVSKDYGRTWHVAPWIKAGLTYDSPDSIPYGEDVTSITVVNNQGFITDRASNLYMSSKPFDDPRLKPGGPGIKYRVKANTEDGVVVIPAHDEWIKPEYPGPSWGMEYFDPRVLKPLMESEKLNYQNLPTKVPEVKNYTGWDHMRCNPRLGLDDDK